jgi:predicted SprT family Zn-dependent metalloprotease
MVQRTIATQEEYYDLIREARKSVNFYIDLAAQKLSIKLPYPIVRFDIKGTTAGTAQFNPQDPTKSIIRFSPTLLRENPDDFLKNVVGHEVAHLIARAKFGAIINPHGSEWQSTAWALGVSNKRCHSYDTSTVPSQLGKVRRRPSLPVVRTEQGLITFVSHAKIIEFD